VSTELDLRGVKCPLSWAKARVRLETLARGDELTLVLDDPQGAHDIPRAAEATGHHVAAVARDGALWRITIEA
jgi:TusA-related sulfurtransferase